MCFLYDDQFLYHCDIPEEMYAISTPKIWMHPLWKTSSSIISKTTAN